MPSAPIQHTHNVPYVRECEAEGRNLSQAMKRIVQYRSRRAGRDEPGCQPSALGATPAQLAAPRSAGSRCWR